MLNLTHGFNGLGKDIYKTRRDTFWDLVWLMLEVWRYWNDLAWNNFIILCMFFTYICKDMITLPIHVMCVRTWRPNNIPIRNLVVYGCLQRNMCIPKMLVYQDKAVWFYDAKRNRQFISCTYIYIYIYLAQGSDFESKGDKLSSSVECRIRILEVWDTKLPADWIPIHTPTELSSSTSYENKYYVRCFTSTWNRSPSIHSIITFSNILMVPAHDFKPYEYYFLTRRSKL